MERLISKWKTVPKDSCDNNNDNDNSGGIEPPPIKKLTEGLMLQEQPGQSEKPDDDHLLQEDTVPAYALFQSVSEPEVEQRLVVEKDEAREGPSETGSVGKKPTVSVQTKRATAGPKGEC